MTFFISDESLGSFGKKREFPFLFGAAASLLKNTHLTKGMQALNRQIEGLPDMPDTRHPIVKQAATIPMDGKRIGQDWDSAKTGKLFLTSTNPWVRLVKKESFLF